ncbi:MAG: hypothetical protein WBN22_03000 [Verrucomicrobiia bacterium]
MAIEIQRDHQKPLSLKLWMPLSFQAHFPFVEIKVVVGDGFEPSKA